MNTYTKHPDEMLCTVSPDFKDFPKPDIKKYADEHRCLAEPDLKDLETLAFDAGKGAKTPSFDREAIVTSILAEWKKTRRELSAGELARLGEKSGFTEEHITIELAGLRRAMYCAPGLRSLAEAAFDAGARDARRSDNPLVEEILEKIVAFRGTETQAKRSTSPIDLAKRATELREADPELTNIESVRAAYTEAGVPLR